MAIPSTMIVPEPLNERNYSDWSDLVRTHLVARDLWYVVDADPGPDQAKTNAAALHAIKISCGSQARSIIRDISSARKAWLMLAQAYAQLSPDEPVPDFDPVLNHPGSDCEKVVANEDNDDYFFRALLSGDWRAAKHFYDRDADALRRRIPNSGDLTPLHLAVTAKNAHVVEDMVKVMSKEVLEMKDCNGSTPLAVATVTGITRLAKCMVEKNEKIVSIPNDRGSIPVVMAISYGCTHMVRAYLHLFPLVGLLYNTTDVALHLLRRCPNLALAKDRYGKTPIYVFSCAVPLFLGGRQLRFWRRWIYNYIRSEPIHDVYNIYIHVPEQENTKNIKRTIISSVLGVLRRFPSYLLKFSGVKDIYEMKSTHSRCVELLHLMGEKIRSIDEKRMKHGLVYDALFSAVDRGNFDFIVKLTAAKPELWKITDADSRDIFMRAIQSRQAEIFSLIHITGDETKSLAGVKVDKFNNNMLHIAGFLAPFTQLNQVSGAALQMQRELQWFKVVESVVPIAALTSENADSLNPRDLFSKNHKDLVIAGEAWMKQTASSCTVVGALIITMTFTATFTLPGGNKEDTGDPIFSDKALFKVFMISNAISLVSSTTSVLMFLGILTSRYAEEDFGISLPRQLMIGLSTLFFSIVSMMIAFCSVLVLVLGEETSTIVSVIMFASIPVTFFVLMQLPLLVEIFLSTYGPSIFSKKVIIKHLL